MARAQLEQIRLVQKQQVQEKLVPAPPACCPRERRSALPAAFSLPLVTAAVTLRPQGAYVLVGEMTF